MQSFLKPLSAIAVISALSLTSGCQTTGGARYVDSGSNRTVVSLDQINIQDWDRAADDLVSSLLSSGVLERAPQQPAILAISRIVNNTQQIVDTDHLTRKIRVALNQTGKVVTTTTIGLGGRVEDPLAAEAAQMQAFMGGGTHQQAMPNYTLSGKLLQDNARAGNTRQVSFIFQLSLTSVTDGVAVWEDEKVITKQGNRPAVGW